MQIVKSLLISGLLGLLSGCFSNGPKVMIETPQAEDDFVVVCSWSSHSFGLHGGKSIVKESVYVASSGEIVDCGLSIFGDDSRAEIKHPLYSNASGCTKREMCGNSRSRMEGDLLIITPKSKQQELDELLKTHTGDDLVRAAKRLGGNFPDDYLGYYSSQKKVSVAHFKAAYEARLKKLWEILVPILKDEMEARGAQNYTVERKVSTYWVRAKAYEKN